MDLSFRMIIIRNAKHGYAIRLKFGEALNPFTKLLLQMKVSTCSTIKENLLLYSRKFSTFVFVVMI